jgi:circadian clock protein KaiC
MTMHPTVQDEVISTGIAGLDDIMSGGFTRRRLFLVEGVPGSGKTTLAMQFLLAGVSQGEPVLYVTLSETAEELKASAASHGWSLDGIELRELAPTEAALDPDEQSTMFHPSEVELAATIKRVLADVERVRPTRLVFDSLSELRLLAGTPLRYRRQILAMKQFFATRRCTVLLLDDLTGSANDLQMHSLAHGVVSLEHLNPEYGSERRRLRIAKYRGRPFRGGHHDYTIRTGGLEVFPRLVAAEHRQRPTPAPLPSDIPELDALLGGGLDAGSSNLIVGAAGTGKSTVAAQIVTAAAGRGQRGALFLFDERAETLLARCDQLHVDLRGAVQAGTMSLQQVDPAELSPGEFTHIIRTAVEQQGVRLIVLDSLNGYLSAMPGERFLALQLHELIMYLGQRGVATILIGSQHGLIGSEMTTPADASYMADTVILLRYFESKGEVRQAISVIKKRGGSHERTVREFKLADGRIVVGDVLRNSRGILTGTTRERRP